MNTEVIESKNPVIRKKAREFSRIQEAVKKFKTIDMQFLQMRGDSNRPRFAILNYSAYCRKLPCTWSDGNGYSYSDLGVTQHSFKDDQSFKEFFTPKQDSLFGTAIPKSDVPQSVAAHVEEVGHMFDGLFVAWEADWQTAKGDPIVIGRIADVYFLVDSWDLTKLETYICGSDFVG
jgi:hypothetical protein